LEREPGQRVLAVAPDGKRESLEPGTIRVMTPGSTVDTDSAQCDNFLEEMGYHYERVNHSQDAYAQGPAH